MNYTQNKSHIELMLNMLSFGIIGISGILLNIAIINFYDSSILGLFNQFLALYFILSQLTTFGIHQSVLSYMPSSRKRHYILSTGIIVVLCISAITSCLIYYFLKLSINYFHIKGLEESIIFLPFVLILFSVNKVLTFALVSIGHMNKFAITNTFRFILLFSGVLIYGYFSIESQPITITFIFSEIGLLILLLSYNIADFTFRLPKLHFFFWIKKHLVFGRYALISGFILDLNSKIDILILSLFVTQAEVGIYSFAAMLAEGFYQFTLIFRNLNTNKIAMTLHSNNGFIKLEKMQFIRKQTIFIGFIGIISIISYKFFISFIISDCNIIDSGFIVYSIYASGIIISAKWIILDNILILKKLPKLDNYVRISSLAVNIIFSFILVQYWGIIGCAIAIFLSLLTNAVLIKYYFIKINK